MDSFKELFKIAGAFVGLVVGAGFASGQEILQFFASFGRVGLLGCVVSTLAFVVLTMAFTAMGQRLKAESHKEVVQALLGRHLGRVFDVLITFFLFAVTVVMLAGAGSLLHQWLGLSEAWGSALATVVTVLIVCLDVRRVIAFIGAITPLLVLTTILIAGYVMATPKADMATLEAAAAAQPRAASHWLIAALLYVSYTVVAGMPFLVIMGGQASSPRVALRGGVLGSLLLGILMLLVTCALYWRMDTLNNLSMPLLALAGQMSPWLGLLMSLVIFGMIVNTAVGMLYAFVARLMPAGTPQFRWATAAGGALALAGSFVGFIALMGTVYPAYGYIGFALIVCTLAGWLRMKSPAAT